MWMAPQYRRIDPAAAPDGFGPRRCSDIGGASLRLTAIPLASLACVMALGFAPRANAYSPNDEVVQGMIDRGVKYLEGLGNSDLGNPSGGYKRSYMVVAAYAHLKAKHDPENDLVRRGVERALLIAKAVPDEPPQKGLGDKSIYELAIAALLLSEHDAERHKSALTRLRDELISRQRNHGGYTYPSEQNGDTSQSQYVVLAMWSLDQQGIKVNSKSLDATLRWYLRVQDPEGPWPYLANDPGPGGGLVEQGGKWMSHGTALAGGSSILIAGDFFDMWTGGKAQQSLIDGLPPAIRLPEDESKASPIRTGQTQTKPTEILTAVRRMNDYRRRVPYEHPGTSNYHFYTLYSLERFESFLEFAEGNSDPEPPWYNEWVEVLKAEQSDNGAWGVIKPSADPPPIATAFSILFLCRSTQQALSNLAGGSLTGGQGLPDDLSEIKVEGGQVKSKRTVTASVTDLLGILEEDGADDLADKAIPDDLKLAEDPADRAAQIDRLKRLARGSRSWQARRVAMRLLAQSDDMQVVPTLIYGLSDNDKAARRYARDGLRFISRKFDGFAMPDDPTDQEIFNAERAWKRWYLTMNPTYVFLD